MLWPAVWVLRALTETSADEERCDRHAYELLLEDVPPTRGLGWLLEDADDSRLKAAAVRLNKAGHPMSAAMLKLACQLITGETVRSREQRAEVETLAPFLLAPTHILPSCSADDQHPPITQ